MSIMIIMFWCQTQKMYAKINFAQIPKKKKKIRERSKSVSILRTTLSILMSMHTVVSYYYSRVPRIHKFSMHTLHTNTSSYMLYVCHVYA